MSVRQVENFVKILKKKKIHLKKNDSNVSFLENSITDKIGLKVIIKNKSKNKGTISIEYKDLDQLNKLIEIIKSNY